MFQVVAALVIGYVWCFVEVNEKHIKNPGRWAAALTTCLMANVLFGQLLP